MAAGLDELPAFLREASQRKFRFGVNDCLLWLADWNLRLTGRDAAAGWRGRCSTRLGAARILRRNGGMVAVTGQAFRAVGWKLTEDPQRGDIAIVDAREGLTGAICLGGGLYAMARFEGVLQIRRVKPVAAWTVD